MYADSSLEVNDKILEHIANQGIYLTAEKFKEHREHPVHTFEVLVSWEGLADIEDSWEPVKIMNEDVPVKLLEYVRSSDDAKLSRFIHRLRCCTHSENLQPICHHPASGSTGSTTFSWPSEEERRDQKAYLAVSSLGVQMSAWKAV
ncbi:hypothetical protein PC121_g8683 [Phytophthora cactorum]|nr:hypothetical protein PC121_g8683 [Phytophthora cactorum]